MCHCPSRVTAWTTCICFAFSALPALALDGSKAAQGMAQRASQAFESGKVEEAETLYLGAWQADPKPAYLYGAAKAAQLAGHREAAVRHYRAYLQNETQDQERIGKAQGALAKLADEQTNTLATDADKQARAGNHAGAAQSLLRAFAEAPARWDLLLRAAQEERAADNGDGAKQRLRQYLNESPANSPGRKDAERWLGELGPKPLATTNVTKTGPSGVVHAAAAPKPEASANLTGWLVTGAGVAVGLGGLGVWLASRSDRSAYDTLNQPSAGGKITTLSYDDAKARADSLRTRETTAAMLGGVGLVAAGIGAWLTLSGPAKIAMTPGPTAAGAGLAWRF